MVPAHVCKHVQILLPTCLHGRVSMGTVKNYACTQISVGPGIVNRTLWMFVNRHHTLFIYNPLEAAHRQVDIVEEK